MKKDKRKHSVSMLIMAVFYCFNSRISNKKSVNLSEIVKTRITAKNKNDKEK